jgi:hypothetical protein
MLAHELRNPLAPVCNALDVLKLRDLTPDAARRARDIMERQVQHLVRLVDDLLDVSRIVGGKIELRRERLDLAACSHGQWRPRGRSSTPRGTSSSFAARTSRFTCTLTPCVWPRSSAISW